MAVCAVWTVAAQQAQPPVPLPTLHDPVSGMTFVRIPAGQFFHGEPGDGGRAQPGRSATRLAMSGQKRDVKDAQRILAALNRTAAATEAASVRHYRLPTEAEWEYACRAGSDTPFATGDTLRASDANFNGRFPYPGSPAGEYRQRPVPVGSFPPNAWGLADMHGNVWEWTADWYGPFDPSDGGSIDPRGPASGDKRVIRGGSWYLDANSARCALRYTDAPTDKRIPARVESGG